MIADLKLSGDETILDLGCGDGVLTELLATLVPGGQVLGIDASQGMITSAKQLKRDNLAFQLMDINELDFHNKFDLIFSNAALHWVKDHSDLMMNCFSALKANGILRFNFAGDGNCQFFNKIIQETMKAEKYQRYFEDFKWPWYMPKLEDYRVLINSYHFKEVAVREENADRYFQTVEDLVKWIDQPCIVPFLKEIPLQLKQDFRETVVNKMLEATKQNNGTYFETFRRINVSAQK